MLGIFGGTFDPIHNGHLNAAQYVYKTLALDELRFMPCNRPPHREPPVASAQDRMNMLKLAIQDFPGFVIDSRELKSNEISYTVTSLTSIRKEVGEEPICLLLGEDAFNQIHTWHEPETIMQLAHIIILGRPDNILNKENLKNEVHDPLKLKFQSAGYVYFAQNALLDISATQIRNMLKHHLTPEFLLPDLVLDYIKRKQLYINF
ncbi:MAG: nicotinate-nucleotide adenylyltransferase [Legionellales bacterium]|jgi:nicotinate-nucleotide adenylyltransferase